MKDSIDFKVYGIGHVVTNQLKPWVTVPLEKVMLSASEIVVQANDFFVLLHQAINQMGSEKSSPAGDEITHLIQISMVLIKKSGGFNPPLSSLVQLNCN